MPRSIRRPAAPGSPHSARNLMLGALTTCLALGGMVLPGTVALGQSSPSNEVDLNAIPTVVNGRISRPTLQPGSQGEAVIELQSMLTLLGYYSGPISGVYQNNTQAAVQQFQADAGINPDGIVGPATWSSLFPAPPSEANPPGTAAVSPAQPAANTPSTPASTGTSQTAPETAPTPATPAPEAEPAATSAANRPVLRLGDRGDAVRQLQERLKGLGFYNGPVDGIFGEQTETAVKQAQTDNNLTVDGIVGPATWGALD